MPRRRKKSNTEEAVAKTHEIAGPEQSVVTQEQASDQKSDSVLASANEDNSNQFRSWVVDTERGYTRLTDELNNRIVIQFSEKPDAETLAAVKKAGFQYKPDYFGQKNCWVRRNDYEGRLRTESIERLVAKRTADEKIPAM